MAANPKQIVKQISRDERLEAFEMFDVDGDGEVKDIQIMIHNYIHPYVKKFYVLSSTTLIQNNSTNFFLQR